ncbi:hypothetical protein GCM10025866_14930 [Naasia aerilata]|uniref:Uncharacterized protein n=1 Tax=Naasia aerilata TaxID=1162966 RepID=A0ABN6XKZ4_9MICO|nr:hypothetical protein GCM10025866_14930 [Naasia aerilata]
MARRRAVAPLGERITDALSYFVSGTPARFAIVVFLALIALFTFLLAQPVMAADGRPTDLADALFTATSAICVTGLATVDMATHWSPLGQVVIVVGTQLGALGVLTLASLMGLVVSRRLGLRQRLLVAGDVNPMAMRKGSSDTGGSSSLSEIGGLLLTVAVSTLVIEGAIAILLYPRVLLNGVDPLTAAGDSIAFSAMSFTNTGFVLADTGFEPYQNDYYFLTLLMIGVTLGAIGFPVIYALSRNLRRPRRWSVHVKLTLVSSAVLVVGGMLAYMILEFNNGKSFGGEESDRSPSSPCSCRS